MGMIANYIRVSESELEEYINSSDKLEKLFNNGEAQVSANFLDLDKAWEGLFFLLTGESLATSDEAAAPLSWVLLAPQEVDPGQDMGYGPALYSTPEQTRAVSDSLNQISVQDLKDRFNGKLMDELGIYPEVWEQPESSGYLIESFESLKEFYNNAAATHQAVIMFIA